MGVLSACQGFNPRLRVGGDLQAPAGHVDRMAVSIRASAWEATRLYPGIRRSGRFQSAPPRGRRQRRAGLPAAARCFNPRLRVGGDRPPLGGHARGAFQSAPPRGRRRGHLGVVVRVPRFNPRLRVGGDSAAQGWRVCLVRFNPRLRVGGDVPGSPQFSRQPCFNPRLRVGGDTSAKRISVSAHLFQSAPPRGRRRQLGVNSGPSR